MSQLACEICGSTNMIKQDGVFVCQGCGMKYSLEEVRKMLNGGSTPPSTPARTSSNSTDTMLKRVFYLLEDSEWKEASDLCSKILEIDPENARAYLGKLMVDLRVNKQENIKICFVNFPQNNNFKKALRFGDSQLQSVLNSYVEYFNKYILPSLQQLAPFEFEQFPQRTTVKITGLKNKEARSVVIPNCVEIIGKLALCHSYDLQIVRIADSVKIIEDNAFNGCKSLHSLTIGNGVKSIGEYAFAFCPKLNSVVIPASVTSIGNHAFAGCENLNHATIGNRSARIGSNAFRSHVTVLYDYSHMSTPTHSSSSTPSTSSSISTTPKPKGWEAFARTFEYEKATDSNTYIIKGVKNRYSITSIDIPNFVSAIGDGAFDNCDKLTSITIPDSVTSIGHAAFFGCVNLTNVTISDSVNYIAPRAFHLCGLRSIVIPSKVTSIERDLFRGCTHLSTIIFGGTVAKWNAMTFGSGWNKNIPATKVICSDGTVDINTSSPTHSSSSTPSASSTDSKSSNSSSATVSTNFKPEGWEAFARTFKYEKVTDSNTFIIKGVMDKKATSIAVPNFVSEIGEKAFDDCWSLQSITLPNSLRTIGEHAFWNCRNLTYVNLPDGVKYIGQSAFAHCHRLTSITIPDSVNEIGACAFLECYELKSITIPNNVKTIYSDLFGRVKKLKRITFKGTVEQWKTKFSDELYSPMDYIKKSKKVICSNGTITVKWVIDKKKW